MALEYDGTCARRAYMRSSGVIVAGAVAIESLLLAVDGVDDMR